MLRMLYIGRTISTQARRFPIYACLKMMTTMARPHHSDSILRNTFSSHSHESVSLGQRSWCEMCACKAGRLVTGQESCRVRYAVIVDKFVNPQQLAHSFDELLREPF